MSYKGFLSRFRIYIFRWLITRLSYVDHRMYMKVYVRFLRHLGYNLVGTPRYISGTARIDGTDPCLIAIGDQAVISSDVRILVHDFSVARIDRALASTRGETLNLDDERNRVAGVSIGANSFIGAYSILMPGVVIGRDCVVGAGSVVRGHVPDGSIVMGNPAQVIRNIYATSSEARQSGVVASQKLQEPLA